MNCHTVKSRNILERITCRIRLDEARHFAGFSPRAFSLRKREPPLDILSRMEQGFAVIAEVKRGSPSRGIIRRNFDPPTIAAAYEAGGAAAVSVLTEKNHFGGSKEYLRLVKERISLPVLRKDFLVHPYQIYESYNLGADWVLLIAACLTSVELRQLHEAALSLGMEALLEVHDESELARVLELNPRIIGINNRDLKTFKVDLDTSLRLKELIPPSIRVISESGIGSHSQLIRLREAGFSGVLVGEYLLKSDNIAGTLAELIHG